jgi:mono/diheme cytochrome c family protein
LRRTTSILLILIALCFSGWLTGCEKDRQKMTDAELGLSPRQARGRRTYNIHCVACHPAYSSHGNKGPGLKELYKKPYLPSGLTATDEHVEQSIVRGRNMMPRFGDQLDEQQIADLIAYLHTL